MTHGSISVQPINEDVADAIINTIIEPVARNLLRVAFGKARGRFVYTLTPTGEKIPLRLPAETFDMAFYVRILLPFFSRPDYIRRILAGETVSPAPVVRTPVAINDDGAERVRCAISDTICRNLVTAALNEARKQLVAIEATAETTNDAERLAPPCRPFDMEFFATVMEEYLSLVWIVEGLLEGQSIARASGWDDE